MSAANPSRTPVESRGKRVPGLYSRRKADGSEVFEYVGRLAGSVNVKTVKLAASTKTDAIAERESLRAATREKRVIVVADRRRRVNDIVDEYVAHLRGLAGTDAELAPRTIENIETKLRLYVCPSIGRLKVAAVEADDIHRMALRAKKRSRSTVHATISVCSGLFRWAVKRRLADTNPVARARELYGAEMMPKPSTKTPRTLSDDEIARAMEHVGDTFAPIVSVTAETGLRISEVLGLRVASFDSEAVTLTVDAQLAKDGSIRKTKTRSSRTIPVSAKAAAVLVAQLERLAADGYCTDAEALIFVTKNGRPQSRRNALRAWQRALERVGVGGAGLHSLRHSFISGHAERSTPVVLVADLVGHSRVTTTQTHYTRVRGGESQRIESLRSVL